MGMTNEQYKGLLLDELENWQRVRDKAEEENAPQTKALAQQQIDKINETLKF